MSTSETVKNAARELYADNPSPQPSIGAQIIAKGRALERAAVLGFLRGVEANLRLDPCGTLAANIYKLAADSIAEGKHTVFG